MQPTLHEYGIYALRLRVKENQDVISYPIELCGPLNADFDGDTVSITLVPEEVKEDTYNKMSPRYKKIYKKNLEPIFVFNHETLNGLNVLSTYVYDDPDELKDPKHYYTDYSQLVEDVEVNEIIKYGTPIVFTGTVGGVKYQNKVTSYGRLRLSKIVGADIDTLDFFKNPPYEAFKAGSALKLVHYLYKYDDFVEKMNEIQKFALKAVTKEGVVTFDFKTLYVDTNTPTYSKIRDVVDNPDLDDKQKLLIVNELYSKYEKEVEERYSEDLKNELSRAGRVKIASIADMTRPQMIISGIGEEIVVNQGDLLSGLDEKEYIYHAVENKECFCSL